MSDRDLVQELKSNIVDLTAEKDEMAKTVDKKQSRIKQVMIKLEHATEDVKHCGHKIDDQNKEMIAIWMMMSISKTEGGPTAISTLCETSKSHPQPDPANPRNKLPMSVDQFLRFLLASFFELMDTIYDGNAIKDVNKLVNDIIRRLGGHSRDAQLTGDTVQDFSIRLIDKLAST